MARQITYTRTKGFTLIEIMVAVAISSLVLITSLALLSSTWSIIRKSQERIYVVGILEARLEELRDLTFDELDALGTAIAFEVTPVISVTGHPISGVLEPADFERDLLDATGMVYITNLNADLKNVVLEVTWKMAGGEKESTMALVTDITRNGVNRQ